MEGLGRILTLGSQARQMSLSCRSTASLFALATRAAQNCHSPHIAFDALVPPLLLGFGPHLCNTAGLAVERHVNVVPAFDEVRSAIAISWPKVLWIDKNVALRKLSLCARSFSFTLARNFGFLCAALNTAAFKNGRATKTRLLHVA
jgi:hypothetical protein